MQWFTQTAWLTQGFDCICLVHLSLLLHFKCGRCHSNKTRSTSIHISVWKYNHTKPNGDNIIQFLLKDILGSACFYIQKVTKVVVWKMKLESGSFLTFAHLANCCMNLDSDFGRLQKLSDAAPVNSLSEMSERCEGQSVSDTVRPSDKSLHFWPFSLFFLFHRWHAACLVLTGRSLWREG